MNQGDDEQDDDLIIWIQNKQVLFDGVIRTISFVKDYTQIIKNAQSNLERRNLLKNIANRYLPLELSAKFIESTLSEFFDHWNRWILTHPNDDE